MYVGLHDVYPTKDLNFAFTRKVKITSFCNFVSLEDKMRKLLVKNWKRKKKGEEKKRGKIINHTIGQKRRKMFALCRSFSWRS